MIAHSEACVFNLIDYFLAHLSRRPMGLSYNFFQFCICDRVWEGVLVSTCLEVSSVVLANVLLCVWRGEGRFTLVVCG